MQKNRISQGLATSALLARLLLFAAGLCGCSSTANTGGVPVPQWELPGLEPCVLVVQPAAVRAGARVMLFGRGFGTDAGVVSVRFGGEPGDVQHIQDTELTVRVPLDAGDELAVTVAGEAIEVRASFHCIAEPLSLSGLDPAEGPVGTEVLISGTGFGTNSGWVTVRFGDIAAEVLSVTPDTLRTAVPVDALSGPVTVTRGVQEATAPLDFTVTVPEPPADPPRINSFAPEAVYPLDEVRITGASFGTELATVQVYIGTVQAKVVALSDTEVVVKPVPGTVSGTVRVVNAAGEATSTGQLEIRSYPEYFSYISDISDLVLGPGGILILTYVHPPDNAGGGYLTIGGRALDDLTGIEGEGIRILCQLPLDMAEGVHFIGIPNKLKDEDKPAGMEDEDVWVTKYCDQPVEVTTVGMQPPLTTGLTPDTIYGNYVGPTKCAVAFDYADYDVPIAVMADGEFLEYYEPGWYSPEEIADHGGLPIGFDRPPELFVPGGHTIMAASVEGYSIADPGYHVTALADLDIRVDSISPLTAKVGDVVTLTGKNLHWEGVGSHGLGPLTIRVGGQPVLRVRADFFYETGILDETRFVVMAETPDGEIEVDIQELGGFNEGEVERTLTTGLTLTVDRGNLGEYSRDYVPMGAGDPEVIPEFTMADFTGLADTGELYFASREEVGNGWNKYLWRYNSGAFTDLGLIDHSPHVLTGFSGGWGSFLDLSETYVRPGGDVHLLYRGEEKYSSPHNATYRDQRLTVWDGMGPSVRRYTLYNSVTGEGSADAHWGSGARTHDTDGGFWILCNGGLLHCTAAGWELVEEHQELIFVDDTYGEQPVLTTLPLHAESDGNLKVFGTVENPENSQRLATCFITRSAAGEWELRQVLGEMEFGRALAYDREGRARVFTNDDERIYIQREEDDFVREEWLAIPFPHGMVKPTGLDYCGRRSTALQLKIGYDHANLAVGTLKTRFAPDWPQAYSGTRRSGVAYVQILLREDGSGGVQSWPVTASPLAAETVFEISLEGLYAEMGGGGYLLFSPSGTKLMLHGAHVEYTYDGNRNRRTITGRSLYTLDL